MSLVTVPVRGVEILAVGTWNGDPYTVQDLDAMVQVFADGNAGIEPPVKLGHNDEQELLAKDGMPAAGYVTALRRVGAKLVADLRDVPKKIADLIQAKAYSKVSSEVYFNLKHEGEKLPRVLKAIALLGADVPAVSSIADIEALYGADLAAIRAHYAARHIDEDARVGVYELPANVSLTELQERLRAALLARYAGQETFGIWPTDVYQDRVIYSGPQGGNYYLLRYTVDAGGDVRLSTDQPAEVTRVVMWRETATGAYTAQEGDDDEEDFVGSLQSLLERLDARHRGSKGMPAMRTFAREMLAKLKGMKARPAGTMHKEDPVNADLLKVLGLAEDADEATVLAKVTELATAKPAAPSQYSADDIRALHNTVGELTTKLVTAEATAAVEDAIRRGKVAPAQKDWASSYALKDLDGFKAYVQAAPQVVPLGELGKSGDTTEAPPVTEADRTVAKQLGISDEKVAEYKAQMTAR